MKITKTKLAAVSFGAALTSLYAAPDLCAQAEDTIDSNAPLTFTPGTVPFYNGPGSSDVGVMVNFNGLPDVMSFSGAINSDPVIVNINNNGQAGYGFSIGNRFLGGLIDGGAGALFELSPGDVFDGLSGGGQDSFRMGTGVTGVLTFGFVSGEGSVGYFRIDLGIGNGPVVFLDGEVAVLDENGENDFTITVPDGDETVVLRGDVNLDGMVNFLDIAPFILRLSDMENQAEADLNEDGVVNFLDISPFIQALTNGGMQVTWSDSTGKPLERFAGNEVLDQQLQAIERKLQDEINTALAQANSSAVEPESASVGLAALALGAVGLRRRRKAATA